MRPVYVKDKMVTNRPKGRIRKPIDDLALKDLILQGVTQLTLAARRLNVSPATLNRHCHGKWGMWFPAYAKHVRKQAGIPERPFSVAEVKALLSAYYTGSLAKTDGKIKPQKVKGIQYRPHESPSTGKSLFELVTYPQLHGVMMELRTLAVAIEGVSVRDGWEYVLRVWIDPTRQATTLPPLMDWNGRPAKQCYEPNARGKALIKQALVAFDKALYRRVINA